MLRTSLAAALEVASFIQKVPSGESSLFYPSRAYLEIMDLMKISSESAENLDGTTLSYLPSSIPCSWAPMKSDSVIIAAFSGT